MKKRAEIGPLHLRRILKFVTQEMVETDSEFFIHKRSVAAIYDIPENAKESGEPLTQP